MNWTIEMLTVTPSTATLNQNLAEVEHGILSRFVAGHPKCAKLELQCCEGPADPVAYFLPKAASIAACASDCICL
jgi:hypothetical protein